MNNPRQSDCGFLRLAAGCALLGAFALIPVLHAAPAPATTPPEQLIRQLGAETFAEREAAEKQLVEAGFEARESVRRELESKDPEVRLRAGRVWAKLRWLVVPDLDAGRVKGLLGSPLQDPEVRRNWDVQLAKSGAGLVPLVLLMWEDAEQRQNAAQVMWQMLDRLDTKSFSAALSRAVLDGGIKPESLRLLLLTSASANETGRRTTAALAALLQSLWLYDDALTVSARGWLSWQDDACLNLCGTAIIAGSLQEKFWEEFDPAQKEKGLYAITYGSMRDRVTLLYVKLAAKLNSPARIAGKVRISNPDTASETDAIISDLVAMRLTADAAGLLENATGPQALYLRSLVRAAQGDAKKAEADRAAAMKALEEAAKAVLAEPKDGRVRIVIGPRQRFGGESAAPSSGEEAVYQMAEIMFKHNDAGSEALYRRVVAMKPDNTVFDANAWLKLARIAESRKEYAAAAECIGKAVAVFRAGSFFFSMPSDDGGECSGDAALELLQRRAAELREKGK